MERAVPIFPARDLGDTLAFYERLGFANAGDDWRRWNYLILERDGAELHFYAEPGLDPLKSDFSCYLRVADADALWVEWEAAGARPEPVATTEYGMREFALVDPSGNLLRVGSAPS